MLIAIMGDAFERATEESENNARLTKLRIMGDYIDLIDKSDRIEEHDSLFTYKANSDENHALNST